MTSIPQVVPKLGRSRLTAYVDDTISIHYMFERFKSLTEGRSVELCFRVSSSLRGEGRGGVFYDHLHDVPAAHCRLIAFLAGATCMGNQSSF